MTSSLHLPTAQTSDRLPEPRLALRPELVRDPFHVVVPADDIRERRDMMDLLSRSFPDAHLHPLLARGVKNFVGDVIADQRVFLLLVLEKGGLKSILSDMRDTKIPQRIDNIYYDRVRNPLDDATRQLFQSCSLQDRHYNVAGPHDIQTHIVDWIKAALNKHP